MYLEKFKLDKKTAVVTGAGQGIGLALRKRWRRRAPRS
jgi:Dehydrogenases with different specificities (related to short-chain alcohol dehydrogenases)